MEQLISKRQNLKKLQWKNDYSENGDTYFIGCMLETLTGLMYMLVMYRIKAEQMVLMVMLRRKEPDVHKNTLLKHLKH